MKKKRKAQSAKRKPEKMASPEYVVKDAPLCALFFGAFKGGISA